MVSVLVEEVKEWNTPVLGAYILWNFTKGFREKHENGDSPPIIFLFIAVGILTDKLLMEDISKRRKNLESYIRGLKDNKKSDILANLQRKIIEKRAYTMSSIDIGLASGLLSWNKNLATVDPIVFTKRKSRFKLPTSIQKVGKQSGVLGEWFAVHTIPSLTAYLNIIL